MAYWRRIGVVGLAMAMWVLCGGVVSTHGNRDRDRDRSPRLSIGSYRLVRVEKIGKNVRQYTFRARLKHRGGAAVSGARAVLIRRHGDFQMIDGELNFGPVRPRTSVPSLDTFSFRHHGPVGLPGHGEYLRWQITPVAGNRPPVANAGPDVSSSVGQRARLDGSRSSDPDGDPLIYRWSFRSKPAASRAELTGANTVTPSFTIDAPGSYEVALTVEDGQATTSSDATVVTTPNTRPVANGGPDQTVALGERTTLSGAASNDTDGDALTYRWRLESRPAGSVASLGGSSGVESSLVPDVPGRYVVQLIVNDGRMDSTPDAVVVSTANSAPVARAGADQRAAVGDAVRLDGSASSDVDGDALRYAWTLVSRPAGSAATPAGAGDVSPAVTIDRAGSYRFRLVVNDGAVSSAPDDVEINTRNTGPVASAGPDAAANLGETVTLDGSGSTDVDGDVLTYAWSLASRPSGSQASIDVATAVSPHFTIDRAGTYVAQLMVSDGTVLSAADTVVVTTRNTAPVAHAGADQSAVAGRRVPLDGSASSDPDGSPVTFEWALTARPAGSNAVLQNPSSPAPWFIADRNGLYVVQLIVNDGALSSEPDTIVISTSNAAPTANAGADRLDLPVGSTVTLDASASADPDGHALTYQWSLVAVPAGSAASLSNSAAATPSFTADRPGEYVAQVIVNDGLLDSAPDTILLRTANRAPVAVAGADQSVAVGTAVTLDAGGSSDPDGDALTFVWQFVSRPNGSHASLSAPALGLGAFSADVSGRFVVRVTVTDGAGASSVDDVDVDATATARLDVPAAASWPPAQVGSSVEQDVIITNSGGVAVTGLAATASGDFAVDPTSPCLAGPLAAGDSCEFQVSFRPTATGIRTGGLSVTSSAPGSPHSVPLSGEGRAASLTVSPGSLTFASTMVGQSSAPAGAVLTNDGLGDVELLNVASPGEFPLGTSAGDRCQVGDVLTPGASCSLSATFSPVRAGARSGSMSADGRGVGDTTVLQRSVALSGDGVVPLVSVAGSDGAASESGPDSGTVTLSRTGSAAAALTVSYTVGGSATGGVDYTALSGTATFAAGAAQAVVTVVPLADALNEGSESVIVTLLDGSAYDLGATVAATVSIEDAYQEVTIVASDAAASEVLLNPGAFTITRIGRLSQTLTVNLAVGGSATPGADYSALPSVVVIPAGAASTTVAVTPLADVEDEPLETVLVTLASGAYVVGTPASASISLGDDAAPRVSVIAVDGTASEVGPDTALLRFSRTGPADQALAFRYTVTGSATNDGATDFTPLLRGDASFAPGSSTLDVVITPAADSVSEGDETVVVTLLDEARYNLGSNTLATVTITDPGTPVVTVSALDAQAAEAGLESGTFRFTRTGNLGAPLTVSFTRGGTAVSGTDYVNIGSSVTFNVGEATTDRVVVPINDPVVEGAETVSVTLADGASYDLGAATTASVTIADQPVPVVSVEVVDGSASEAGDTGLLRFTRAGDTTFSLQFTIARGGSATNSSDYSNISTTLTFPTGAATLERAIVPVNDTAIEGTETVSITVVDGANYDVGAPVSGSVEILDQPIPIVTVAAIDPSASETGLDAGVFRFTRVGDVSLTLTVNYVRAGTAAPSVDFASFGSSITFPVGAATVDRVITPVANLVTEPAEFVILTLSDGAQYDLGASTAATVTITD
jgi:hypothetical protein